MTPTDKDLAEFALLGLDYKFLGLPTLVAWGDEVIETRDDPPTWALDLSMAVSEEAAQSVLSQMRWLRGDLTPLIPERLLVALMKRDWQNGKLKWEQVCWPLWIIIPEKDCRRGLDLPFVDVQLIREMVDLVDCREFLSYGSIKDDDINNLMDRIFATSDSNVILLPNWV